MVIWWFPWGIPNSWIVYNGKSQRQKWMMKWGTLSGWWFGTWLLFFHSVGNVILPFDELIFFKMVIAPPTRFLLTIINHIITIIINHMNRILTTILTTYYDLGVPYFRKPPYPVAWFTMLIMITINHISTLYQPYISHISTRFDPIDSRKQWLIPYPIYPVAIYDIWLIYGYGSIPIDTFLAGWTSINPSYDLGFTRYQGFDPSPYDQVNIIPHHSYITRSRCFDRNPAAVPIFTLRWSHGGFRMDSMMIKLAFAWSTYKKLWKMGIEIVDVPIEND